MHSKYSHISVREIIRNPISMFGLEGGNHVVKIFTDNSARGNTQVIFYSQTKQLICSSVFKMDHRLP